MPPLNLLDPKNVAALTAEDLANEETLHQLQAVADEYLKGGDVGDAQATVLGLLKVIKSLPSFRFDHPELWEQYQALVTQLQWTCLPVLTDDEVENLIAKHLLFAFEREVEIEAKLGGYFRIHKDVETLGFRRLLVLRAMQANQERVGSDTIVRNTLGEPVVSTVQHWLQDYDRFAPAGRLRGVLAHENYLTQSANVKKLSPEFRELVRRLIRMYDFLRFPKLPVDIVEPTGHRIPEQSLVAPLPVDQTPPQPSRRVDLAHQIAGAYSSLQTGGEEIANQINWVKEMLGANVTKLRDGFQMALQAKNVTRLLAILCFSIQQRLISQLFVSVSEGRDFQSWLQRSNLPLQRSLLSTPALLSRQSVRLLIQYLLQVGLGMSESDAARIGMQLGNRLRQHGHPELAALAYYDVKEGRFRWME